MLERSAGRADQPAEILTNSPSATAEQRRSCNRAAQEYPWEALCRLARRDVERWESMISEDEWFIQILVALMARVVGINEATGSGMYAVGH